MRFEGVLLLAVAVAACGGDDGAAREQLAGAAVGIVAGGCSLVDTVGSGVVVEREGQIATVAHTIRGADEIAVVDADGRNHAATVVAFDADSDLAVLDAPTLRVAPLPIGDVELGEGSVLVWDRDAGTSAKQVDVVKRLRISIEDIYVENTVERTGLEVEGSIEIGDSGAAVVSEAGEVIGIVYANSRERDGVGFATDSAELRDVLSRRSLTEVPNGRCR
ncbi:MAG: serine protease [Acidimicrobiia bacterium]|nr:serine protease [Acidimicrobiia bacterium]